MGNRTQKVHNSTTTNYTYDAADEMTAAGGVSYGYDNNGNQTSRGSDTFGWDHENRMTSTSISGTSGSYAYTGDGLRTSRTIGGTTVSYEWDVAASLPSVLQDSSTNTYVYGLGLISRTDSGGAQAYYLADALGSTVGLASGSGAVTDTYTYDVFGTQRSHGGSSAQEFTFTGQQLDGDGLQFLRARYYDGATGRFLTKDPIPFAQRYSYAGSQPLNYIDPTGLFGWDDIAGCVGDPVECGEAAGGAIVDAAVEYGGGGIVQGFYELGKAEVKAATAFEYCATSAHLFECFERLEVGATGVAVTAFGGTIAIAGCGVIAPVVGAATVAVGGVATCGLALFAGGTVVAGGLLMIDASVSPWHHGAEAAEATTQTADNKE